MYKILLIAITGTMLLARGLITPIPEKITHDEKKAALGKKLFFDPVFSRNNDVSCFSCHHSYGADDRAVSLGTKGQKGTINAPSVFNAVFDIAFFHNGRAANFGEQALDTIKNPLEMNSSEALVQKRLRDSKEYSKAFDKVYGRAPTMRDALDALAEYQKTLITPGAKFDRYLRGKTQLSQKEQKGYELFKNYGCISCHNGKNVGGNSYQKFGNVIDFDPFNKHQNDRYQVTKKPEDKNVFKVPSLRNVTKTAPYFHTGSVKSLPAAVNFMAVYNLGTQLDDTEIDAIIAFLKTLEAPQPESYTP